MQQRVHFVRPSLWLDDVTVLSRHIFQQNAQNPHQPLPRIQPPPFRTRTGSVFVSMVTQASYQIQQRVKVKVNLSCARDDELCASKYVTQIIFSAGTRRRSAVRFTSRKIYPLGRQRTANQKGGSASARAGVDAFKKRESFCLWREPI
jgi:hypothetical protein